jgi:Tfp pilus assembly protein PilF
MPKNKQSQNFSGLPPHVLDMLREAEDLKYEGKHQQAIELAEKILFEDPTNVPALEEVADNYLSIDQYEKAEKAAKQALKIDAQSYTAYYILGFISSQQQNWEESVRYLSKANTIHPNNPEILRCLGWAIYNNTQKIKGLVTLERALNLDPENSLILCDLGVCYMQSKDFDKALSLFYKTLEVDPNNQRAKECVLAAQGFHNKFKNKRK